MAYASHIITEFPARPESPSNVTPIQPHVVPEDGDPTRDIRNYIGRLEEAARESRRNQRTAEEECERLRFKLAEAEVRAETPRPIETNLKALIKERDMLLEQQNQYGPVISELKQKVKTFEAERYEAIRERDEFAQTLKVAQRKAENALRAAEEAKAAKEDAARQQEIAIRQRNLANEEKERAHAKVAETARNLTEARKALAEAKKEIATPRTEDLELAKQRSSLRQARDGMAAQIYELNRKLGELEDEVAELTYARDAAEKAARESREQQDKLRAALTRAEAASADSGLIQSLEATIGDLKSKIASLEERGPGSGQADGPPQAELSELRGMLETVTAERDTHAQAISEAHTSLISAQKQIEAIARDRDTQRQEFSQSAIVMEAELMRQIAEVAQLKKELSIAGSRLLEATQLGEHFDTRRLEMIELSAQLENAHREIRILSASLAEARLQAKMAAKKVASDDAASKGRLAKQVVHEDAPGKATFAAIRKCHQAFDSDPAQPALLNELRTITEHLAGTTRDHGLPILHRITVALASLLGDLSKFPDQITEGLQKSIGEAIDQIGVLLSNPEAEGTVHLGDARVFVVDDDQNTCDTIVDALNLVSIPTDYTLHSTAAMTQLAATRYNLIVLDINLPELDGFELCSHIREMALHVETPIFFISGHTSLENRVKSSLRGGNAFIAKPFNLQELALRSLKSIIAAQLQAAGF